MEYQNPNLKILHVLTLNGPYGEYGGPVRVAREHCSELIRRGHQARIISGARKNSEPVAAKGLEECFVLVRPLIRKLPVSSLWSWKLLTRLSQEIRQVDLVHIHFARDLVPFLAAVISILNRKPFVTQTHGMIIFDGRFSTRIIDLLLTRPLMNRSKANIVLTENELKATKQLRVKVNSIVIPNGISVEKLPPAKYKSGKRIIFCARLDKRKGVEKFIQLAKEFEGSNLSFEIFGPDEGELGLIIEAIEQAGPSGNLKYKGSMKPEHVQNLLKNVDLLVLPSKDEPFPMVVLEALSVGTPVLVMPSCGLAEILGSCNRNFVASSEDYLGLRASFKIMYRNNFMENTHLELIDFCDKYFGINKIADLLESCYLRAIAYA